MCFHKYGKIEGDGYQYCTKCGKAIHQCKWKYVKQINVFGWDSVTPESLVRLYECEICGKMKQEEI